MTEPRRLTAKFPGTCRGCGEGIDPGDEILWYGSRVTYHAGCRPEPLGFTVPKAAAPAPANRAGGSGARWTRPADPDDDSRPDPPDLYGDPALEDDGRYDEVPF